MVIKFVQCKQYCLSLQQYMDIPEPKDEDSDNSNKDVMFQYKPKTIIKKGVKKQNAYRLTYKKSFQTLIANRILKKTLNTSWAERYFILTSTRILYYCDSSMKQLKGCFNLASLIEHSLQINFKFPQINFVVKVNTANQEIKTLLQLMIEDKYLFKDWQRQLKRVMGNLLLLKTEDLQLFPRIKKESILQTASKIGKSGGNFWNNVTISSSELNKYASHLDIILLRSKNPIFYLHRFFMRSYYDHVGILIKDQTQKIFVFQAIQSKGVCISSLQSLLTTFSDEYEELGYRKLLIESNANFHIQQLEDYINSLLGSKYQLSISKLLIDNQTVKPSQAHSVQQSPQTKQQKQEKTYFCSQLIADIYLRFGILCEGKSNNYWPKDFEENQIVLSKGFKFSPIMRLELEHQEHSDQSQN